MDQFKKCSHCGLWLSRDDFVHGGDLHPIGISFFEGDLKMACYYFQHDVANCGTCLVVPVVAFESFITEPKPPESMALKEECEHHCTTLEDLSECHQKCLFAPYRRFLLRMLKLKGHAGAEATPLIGQSGNSPIR